MKIDLSRHITDYINRFDSVHLPSLGRFTKEYKSASFADSLHELSAPSIKLTFSQSNEENDDLADWISVREGISFADAQKLVAYFVKLKTEELNANGQTQIYPLGQLTVENDAISFLPKDSSLINEYFGLQNIQVSPAERSASEKTIASIDAAQPFSNLVNEQEDGNPIWRWLGIILLALILILVFKTCLDQRVGKKGSSTSIEADTTKELSANQADTSLGEKALGKIDSTLSEINPEKIHIDQLDSTDIDTVLESEELKNAPPGTLVECVIILGSYKNQRNAIRMMRDVEKAGYELYVGVNGDFTRVGLTYNCAKADLVAYIQKVRREFVREAWYLIPQLRVEYED